MRLGPREIVVVVAEFGVLEFGESPEGVVFGCFFDLSVEEGSIPCLAGKKEQVAKVEFDLVDDVLWDAGHLDDVVEQVRSLLEPLR